MHFEKNETLVKLPIFFFLLHYLFREIKFDIYDDHNDWTRTS